MDIWVHSINTWASLKKNSNNGLLTFKDCFEMDFFLSDESRKFINIM